MKNMTLVAGPFPAVGLIAGILSITALAAFASDPIPGVPPTPTCNTCIQIAKAAAADSLRHTAQKINNNANIPNPPRSDIVAKLNDKVNQLGSLGFNIPPCAPAIRFCDPS